MTRGGWLLLAPFLAAAAVLVALPAVITFALSATDADLLRAPRWVGLANFEQLVGDPIVRQALLNSAIFVAVAVPLRLAVATALALALHRRGSARRAASYLPTVVPDVAFALLFLFLLNPIYGPVNGLLGAVGLPQPEWFTTAASAMAALVLMAAFTVGEGFVVALAARRELPAELDDAARVEGASDWFRTRRVTLPLMAPTLVFLAVRDLAWVLQVSFVPAFIVTGGGPDRATLLLPQLIYESAFEDLRYGYAAAVTLTLFALTAAAGFAGLSAFKRVSRGNPADLPQVR